jgi:hypothetical protein
LQSGIGKLPAVVRYIISLLKPLRRGRAAVDAELEDELASRGGAAAASRGAPSASSSSGVHGAEKQRRGASSARGVGGAGGGDDAEGDAVEVVMEGEADGADDDDSGEVEWDEEEQGDENDGIVGAGAARRLRGRGVGTSAGKAAGRSGAGAEARTGQQTVGAGSKRRRASGGVELPRDRGAGTAGSRMEARGAVSAPSARKRSRKASLSPAGERSAAAGGGASTDVDDSGSSGEEGGGFLPESDDESLGLGRAGGGLHAAGPDAAAPEAAGRQPQHRAMVTDWARAYAVAEEDPSLAAARQAAAAAQAGARSAASRQNSGVSSQASAGAGSVSSGGSASIAVAEAAPGDGGAGLTDGLCDADLIHILDAADEGSQAEGGAAPSEGATTSALAAPATAPAPPQPQQQQRRVSKLLVFAHHSDVLEYIEAALRSNDPPINCVRCVGRGRRRGAGGHAGGGRGRVRQLLRTTPGEMECLHLRAAHRRPGGASFALSTLQGGETLSAQACRRSRISFLDLHCALQPPTRLAHGLPLALLVRCSIDGSTPPKRKQELKNAFQENPAVQVAVVGLTAAGVGLSFTAASMSVFAELHWTPVRLRAACPA